MALGVCGWIGAILCCILCSGFICTLIFGGTIFVGLLAFFTAVNNCEGADLEAAKLCIPITSQLVNATMNYEPKFENSKDLERLIGLCGEATVRDPGVTDSEAFRFRNFQKCIKNVNCVSHRIAFLKTERNHCDVYNFIKDEFGSCAEKLKKKAEIENLKCLKFLFGDGKCENWMDNQECIDKEIQEECGETMGKRFATVSETIVFYFLFF